MKHNWSNYYYRIQDVCPFSGFAYTHGALLHVPFKNKGHVLQNEQILKPMGLWGCVYESVPWSVEELEQFVNKMNERKHTNIIYFFSHPEHSPNGRATAIPVIIQQRRDILEAARRGEFHQIQNEESTATNITPQTYNKRLEKKNNDTT